MRKRGGYRIVLRWDSFLRPQFLAKGFIRLGTQLLPAVTYWPNAERTAKFRKWKSAQREALRLRDTGYPHATVVDARGNTFDIYAEEG